jgi:Na+-driven multidrug efflux pump
MKRLIPALLLALLGATFAGRASAERVFHVDGVGLYLLVAVALALFEVVFTVATQVLNASYDAGRLAIAALVSHVVYAGGLLVAFGNGWGVVGVLAAAAAGNAVACAMVWGRVRDATAFVGADEARTDAGGERPRPAVTRLRYSCRLRPSNFSIVV